MHDDMNEPLYGSTECIRIWYLCLQADDSEEYKPHRRNINPLKYSGYYTYHVL
jgi:hypothetical protein